MTGERLGAEHRVLCLLGPLAAVWLFAMAWVVVPYVWRSPRLASAVAQPCVLKRTTGIPCPFCGATRAVVSAAHGEWRRSLTLSPVGILLVGGGPLVALWRGLCAATGRDLGLRAIGRRLSARAVVRGVVGLILALWAWNMVRCFAIGG